MHLRRGTVALLVLNIALVLFLAGGWLAYRQYGHAVIRAAYEGRSVGFLNRMIRGQATVGLGQYYAQADRMFRHGWFWLAAVVFGVESLVLYGRGLGRRLREPLAAPARPAFELFLISFLILFFELAAIRWFPAYVVYLTFFSNFVLMGAFLGMSVGCLAARRRVNLVALVPPLVLVAVMLAGAVYLLVTTLGAFALRVGNPYDPEHVFFGTQFTAQVADRLKLPLELVIAVFFVLVALIFAGLGQELGRGLDRFPNRIKSYTINIGGSLAGIVGFTALSYLSAPAVVWFAIAFAGFLWFLRFRHGGVRVNLFGLVVTGAILWGMEWGLERPGTASLWSPYYHIVYRQPERLIAVNTIGHQEMADREKVGMAYSLPFLLRRDSGGPPLKDVLIIGAGSGNDAAHALWHGAQRIDAVEIDPVIARLGRRDHPNRPYDDPRVRLIVKDGRNVLTNAPDQYDLIVYALVDSLTLHSTYSSVRLESFLFTRQAIEAIRARLKPHGLFVAYNNYREGWVVTRLRAMLAEVFQQEPIVISLSSGRVVSDTDRYGNMMVLLAGDIEGIRRAFQAAPEGAYALHTATLARSLAANGFRPDAETAADTSVQRLRPAEVRVTRSPVIPTDDWPFFYLRSRRIPAHNLWGLGLVAGLSLILVAVFSGAVPRLWSRGSRADGARGNPGSVLRRLNPHFLFLGAAFMLVETNSVIRLALLFGSTWLVNSVVFFSILVMILAANVYVVWRKPTRMRWYYAALAAALAVNLVVDLDWFLAAGAAVRAVVSCLLVFLPILFAGVIFSSSFRRSANPDLDFGANIAGSVLGGILEYAALITGYRLVLVLVVALYALSLVGLRRLRAAPA